MTEQNELSGLWVARDADGWTCISVSANAPRPNSKTGLYATDGKAWSMGISFGEAIGVVKPGECVRLVTLLPVDEEQERVRFERALIRMGRSNSVEWNDKGLPVWSSDKCDWFLWLAAKRDVGTQGG